MAIIFGSGEPVSRLRRAFDVKGKVNLGVDEVIVPTIQLQDAEKPPFRRTGVRWYNETLGTANVGRTARVRLTHKQGVDQLLDTIIMVGTSNPLTLLFGVGDIGFTGGVFANTTEVVRSALSVMRRGVPIRILGDDAAAPAITTVFFRLGSRAEETIIFKTDIVIPAMSNPDGPDADSPTFSIEAGATDTAFRIGLSGLYFDSLPLNAQT